jgi:hypothetical protein
VSWERAREAEMASAAAIQRAMLPQLEPRDFAEGELDIFADMIPAREVVHETGSTSNASLT